MNVYMNIYMNIYINEYLFIFTTILLNADNQYNQ